jgi:hypothetical protein
MRAVLAAVCAALPAAAVEELAVGPCCRHHSPAFTAHRLTYRVWRSTTLECFVDLGRPGGFVYQTVTLQYENFITLIMPAS